MQLTAWKQVRFLFWAAPLSWTSEAFCVSDDVSPLPLFSEGARVLRSCFWSGSCRDCIRACSYPSGPDKNIDKWKFIAVLLGQTKAPVIWEGVGIKGELSPVVSRWWRFSVGAKDFIPGGEFTQPKVSCTVTLTLLPLYQACSFLQANSKPCVHLAHNAFFWSVVGGEICLWTSLKLPLPQPCCPNSGSWTPSASAPHGWTFMDGTLPHVILFCCHFSRVMEEKVINTEMHQPRQANNLCLLQTDIL